MTLRTAMRSTALILMTVVIAWFFSREIHRHWLELSSMRVELHAPMLVAAVLLVIAGYLTATFAWRRSLLLSTGQPLTLAQGIALVNISQLAKYIPGKVWFYAIQMHLLAGRGVNKATVLSLNAIMLASLAGSAAVAGMASLLLSGARLPAGLAPALLAAAVALYVTLVVSGSWSVDLATRAANRVLGTTFAPLGLSARDGLLLHALYLLSNLLYGAAGYATALGVGVAHDMSLLVPIGGSMLLSDIAGFLAFIMPGGIGVREGIMYAMLKPLLDVRVCFIIPVAFRLVTTVSDLLLGGIALWFLRRFSEGSQSENEI